MTGSAAVVVGAAVEIVETTGGEMRAKRATHQVDLHRLSVVALDVVVDRHRLRKQMDAKKLLSFSKMKIEVMAFRFCNFLVWHENGVGL